MSRSTPVEREIRAMTIGFLCGICFAAGITMAIVAHSPWALAPWMGGLGLFGGYLAIRDE